MPIPTSSRSGNSGGVPVGCSGGTICAGETHTSVVKVTFAKGASLEDPTGLVNSRPDGNVGRAIDFHEGDAIDNATLTDLLRAVVALNAAPRSVP